LCSDASLALTVLAKRGSNFCETPKALKYFQLPQSTGVIKRRRAELNVEVGDKLNRLRDDAAETASDDAIAEAVVIDSKQNLIVHHPDLLVSSTTVSNALGCLRKAVLNERFKVWDIFGCFESIYVFAHIQEVCFR